MDYMEIISVPVIATIVYWIISALKSIAKNSETFKRFIPLLSGGIGALLGIVLYYTLPEIIAASNVVVALMSGAASGMTATGCHQVIKQLSGDKNIEEKSNEDDNAPTINKMNDIEKVGDIQVDENNKDTKEEPKDSENGSNNQIVK